jgi:hypothetical protein
MDKTQIFNDKAGCTYTRTDNIALKDKGKAIPLHAWTSPKCSRRWRLPDFKTIGT